MNLKWTRHHDNTWSTSDGYGVLRIQGSRKTKRWYLMREGFGQAPLGIGNFATRAEAQKAAEPKPLKRNPAIAGGERLELLKKGARLFEEFSGHDAEVIGRVKAPTIPRVLVQIGKIDFIGYRTMRDGEREKYIHKFKGAAKPLFCVTPDGKQIFLIGGSYEFTEQGIIDKT